MNFKKPVLAFCVVAIVLIGLDAKPHILSKRENRCPLLTSVQWKERDAGCQNGTAFHCLEDEQGKIVLEACLTVLFCIKGAHPFMDEKYFVCAKCQNGFQPKDEPSNKFTYSYCEKYSPECDPKLGQSECRKATAWSDRGCMCNSTLGFTLRFPDIPSCMCFSSNDPCPSSPCQFTNCTSGFTKNDRGFCEANTNFHQSTVPLTSSSSFPSTSTQPPEPEDKQILVIVLPIVGLVVLICVVMIILMRWRRQKLEKQKEKDESKLIETNENTNESTKDVSEPPVTEIHYHLDNVHAINVEGEATLQIRNAQMVGFGENNMVPVQMQERHLPDQDCKEQAALQPSASIGDEVAAEEQFHIPTATDNNPHSFYGLKGNQPTEEKQTSGLKTTKQRHPIESHHAAENYQPTAVNNAELPGFSTGGYSESSAPPLSLQVPSAPPHSLPYEDRDTDDFEMTLVKQPYHQRLDQTEKKTVESSGDDDVTVPLLHSPEEHADTRSVVNTPPSPGKDGGTSATRNSVFKDRQSLSDLTTNWEDTMHSGPLLVNGNGAVTMSGAGANRTPDIAGSDEDVIDMKKEKDKLRWEPTCESK